MKTSLSIVLVALTFGAEAFANNYFIPNYYRNRRVQNQYSALGFSDRHEANVEVAMPDGETKVGGTKTNEDKGTEITASAFHRLQNNVNLEATVVSDNSEDKTVASGNKDKSEELTALLGVGYQMDRMAFGASIETLNDKSKPATGSDSTDKDQTLRLGAGMMLENQWFVGVGYQNLYENPDAGSNETNHTYLLGGGKVWGDLKKAETAMEAYLAFANQHGVDSKALTVKALHNMEAMQVYGGISYSTVDDKGADQSGTAVVAGVDYEFAEMFYVGPQLTWFKFDNDGPDEDIDLMEYSLEAGYRKDKVEAFVRYNHSDVKVTDTPSDAKRMAGTIAVGGSYFF